MSRPFAQGETPLVALASLSPLSAARDSSPCVEGSAFDA